MAGHCVYHRGRTLNQPGPLGSPERDRIQPGSGVLALGRSSHAGTIVDHSQRRAVDNLCVW